MSGIGDRYVLARTLLVRAGVAFGQAPRTSGPAWFDHLTLLGAT